MRLSVLCEPSRQQPSDCRQPTNDGNWPPHLGTINLYITLVVHGWTRIMEAD